jgi:transcription antitermination factor NusG
MQKNWYLIYTKANWEKKVASKLLKKKIENYYPLQSVITAKNGKAKVQKVPLFPNYLFVKASENDRDLILSLNKVINFVYWKQRPALVSENDILLIKDFTENFCDIKVQKVQVNGSSLSHLIDGATHSYSENILKIKNTVAKVKLPMIGFVLSAEIDGQKSLQPLLSPEAILHLQ